MVDKFHDVIDVNFTADMEKTGRCGTGARPSTGRYCANSTTVFPANCSRRKKDLEKEAHQDQRRRDRCGLRTVRPQNGHQIRPVRQVFGLPGYPECKNTKPITEDTGVLCPLCGAKVVKKKKSRSGYYYYGCEKDPTCNS